MSSPLLYAMRLTHEVCAKARDKALAVCEKAEAVRDAVLLTGALPGEFRVVILFDQMTPELQ